jgi:hypothetical protein
MVLKIKESLQSCQASVVVKSELLPTTHRNSENFDELTTLVLDCCETKHIWRAGSPSPIMCNNFRQAQVGVDYTAMASNSVQGAQVNATQFQSHGNIWTGPFGQWAANGNGMAGTIITNRFHILTNELTNFGTVTTPMGWFSNQFTVNTLGCPQVKCRFIAEDEIFTLSSDDRVKMAGSGSYSDLTSYLDLKTLYADAKTNQSLQNDPAAIAFVQSKSSTSYGRLTHIAKQVADLERNVSDAITSDQIQANNLLESLDQLNLELENGVGTIDAQLNQRSILHDQLEQVQVEITNTKQQNLSTKVAVKQNLLTQLSEIVPQSDFDAADKQLLELYIKTAFVQVPLTSSQKISLFTLAQMCEHTYGTAVLQARAWYLAETGHMIEGSCETQIGERNASLQPYKYHMLNTVSISPNPAQQSFILSLSWAPTVDCTVKIMNPVGQVVKTLQVQAGNEKLEVQNLQLTVGVYKLIVYEKDVPSAQATLNISE